MAAKVIYWLGEKRFVKISGNGTAYELTGSENAPVVVLIHGIGLNRHLWADYVPALSVAYRVLNYDLFGYGDSRHPEQELSLSLLADQLCELLDELKIESCAIVGFSLGGMINRRFAMDYPARCWALVVLCSPHERSAEAQQLVEDRLRQTQTGGSAATLKASLQRWFTKDFLATEVEIIDRVSGWVLAADPRIFSESRYILARGVRELLRPEPPLVLSTLVMTCELDSGSTPEMSFAIAAEIAGSKTAIVPDLQHLGMLEQPELFIEPIRAFLMSVRE
ncbi:MAG: pimeloyl-ACP methyl ester carboxylesterase [Planctomycetota bacterium]|jgi:pimeloyl-ACP methyl ester carboxylesterase